MSLQGLKVLVVDDDETARLLLTTMLAELGAEARAVQNGERAVGALRAASRGRPFDAAIVDCRMPSMDGGNVALVVAADPTISGVDLVLTSSATQLNWARAAHLAGIRGYLSKPVQKGQLWHCLSTIMTGLNYGLIDEGCDKFKSDESLDPAAIHALRELGLNTGDDIFSRVAELYLLSAQLKVDEVSAGVSTSHAEQTNEAAHGLKGSSATIGANRLAGLCAHIEQLARESDWQAARAMIPAFVAEFRRVCRLLNLELTDQIRDRSATA
ncbi:MAG: Hpt domain-containing response regulator [Actinomycetota bacterium]